MKSLQEENVRLRVQPMEERESKYSTPPDGRSLEKSLRSIDKHMDQRKKRGLESSKPKEDGSRDRKGGHHRGTSSDGGGTDGWASKMLAVHGFVGGSHHHCG